MDAEANRKAIVDGLKASLGAYIPRNAEADTIGELLYEMQRIEWWMTSLIGLWSFPVLEGVNRFEYMRDELLLKIPIRDKLQFLLKFNFLEKTQVDKLQAIFDRRNFLAHPRPLKRQVTKTISSAEKADIIATLRKVQEKINDEIERETDSIIGERKKWHM